MNSVHLLPDWSVASNSLYHNHLGLRLQNDVIVYPLPCQTISVCSICRSLVFLVWVDLEASSSIVVAVPQASCRPNLVSAWYILEVVALLLKHRVLCGL